MLDTVLCEINCATQVRKAGSTFSEVTIRGDLLSADASIETSKGYIRIHSLTAGVFVVTIPTYNEDTLPIFERYAGKAARIEADCMLIDGELILSRCEIGR